MKYYLLFFICIIESCFAQDSIVIYNQQLKVKNNDVSVFQNKLNYLQDKNNLEEYYYAHFDYFLLNPIKSRITFLQPKNPWRKPSTEAEKIAKLHVLINLAYHYKKFGDLSQANQYYEQGFDYYNSSNIRQYDIVAYALKPLANNYTRIGDYAKAEEILTYIIDLVKNDKDKLVGAYTNLSILYQSNEESKKAIELLENIIQTTNLSTSQKSSFSMEIAKNYYELGRLEKAIFYANKTFDYHLSKKINQRLLILQGLILVKQDKSNLALKSFNAAISLTKDIYGSNNRELAKVYVLLAQTYASLNQDVGTITNYQKALQVFIPFEETDELVLPSTNVLFAENTFVDIFDGLATIFLKQNKKERYLDALLLSNEVSKKLRNNFTAQQSKLIQQTTNKKRTNNIVQTCFELYKDEKNKKWMLKALQVIENNKAIVLQENIKNKNTYNVKGDSLSQLKVELEKEKAQLHSKILVEQNKQSQAKSKQIKKWNEQKTKTDSKLQLVNATIEKDNPFLSSTTTLDILSIQEKCMIDKHLFVNYFETDENWFVFYFDNESDLNWHIIKNTDKLKNEIQAYINLFVSANEFNNNITSYQELAVSLFEIMLKPVLKSDYKNITIFPDGKLNFMCFDALLQNKVSHSNFSDYPFLIKDYVLNSSFSMQVLMYQNENKESQIENKTIGYFPVFANNERGLQTLKYTVQEKNDLEQYAKADVLIDKYATKEYFLNSVSNYHTIHLSTHASAGDFYNPAVIHFIDEPLYLPEIYGLHMQNNLVVLSACETGIGKLQKGEGVMSLARGFSYAGVKNLVVSLWKVNDKSTSLLMRDFYKNKQMFSNEKALQLAKLAYLENESISNLKKTPYYWSGFVSIGNVDEVSNLYPFWIGILILFMILGIYIFIKRKG